MRALLVLLLATPAFADGTHRVETGETLAHVAQRYGCTLAQIERANGVDTSIVAPGSVVRIPDCRGKQTTMSDEERAAAALATIDGATVVKHHGTDIGASLPPDDEAYHLRRPTRAYGQPNLIAGVQRTIAAVRASFPEVHTLAIGDVSAREGGKLANHLSHQTGLDIDIGFYFARVPKGYPDAFAAADDDLDFAATWALLNTFARDPEVSMIFLDRDVTARLVRFAKQHQLSTDDVARVVKHWPGHRDHLHVRFKQP